MAPSRFPLGCAGHKLLTHCPLACPAVLAARSWSQNKLQNLAARSK